MLGNEWQRHYKLKRQQYCGTASYCTAVRLYGNRNRHYPTSHGGWAVIFRGVFFNKTGLFY